MGPKEKMNLREQAVVNSVSRKRDITLDLLLKGHWHTELWRRKKSGLLVKIDEQDFPNDITTIGKNTLFNTMWNALTQVPAVDWCAGLINLSGFTGYNAADTMASHAGWAEWTAYSQTTRVPWTQGTAASAAITNASPMVFDINGTGDVRGLFLTTVNTKGGTTGILWSAASYTNSVNVIPGDQIRSTYSLSC